MLPWNTRTLTLASLWNTLFQDLRFGLRQLRKSPAFTLAAVLTLALGIGANTTVFTWLNSNIIDPPWR